MDEYEGGRKRYAKREKHDRKRKKAWILILLLLLVTAIAIGVTVWALFFRQPAVSVLAPDYAPQEIEQNAESMEGNNTSKLDAPEGGGSVNLLFNDEVAIDLSDNIKNIDLPEKLSRNTKQYKVRENKKHLGRSIEERPETVDLREEFGHWEIDSVLGRKKENEAAVVALTERKHRNSIWLKVKNHSAEAVDEALDELLEAFGDKYCEIFKTITSDNGAEFANLSRLEDKGIGIYFTHPYTSCEKGTVECHNRMLRRFIPKGKSIEDYTADEIMIFADIINALPRKILNYRTPEELFDAELDRIYAA